MPKRAEKYIEQVTKQQVLVCKWVRLAVQRHLDDLKRSRRRDYPYYFSPIHAERAIECIELQRLAFGNHRGAPFVLQPWQAFVVYCIYGWRKKRGHDRRFVKALIEVARGNAKTELSAAIGNIGLMFEAEQDPQVFWIATKKDQARIGFERQKTMVEYLRQDDETVAECYDTLQYAIFEKEGYGNGKVKYLGKEFKGEDGFSPYYILGDEYHAWKDDSLIHVLESGLVKRDSSLTFIISSEGYNPEGPFAQMKKRCKQMLQGDAPNEQMFALLCELDEGDNWEDRAVWPKANPSMGVTVSMEGMEAEFQKARAEGIVKINDFKTKNLNIPVASHTTWIPEEAWAACGKKFDPAILEGRICFGGLDFSRNRDLTAWALFFPSENLKKEPHYCLVRFWLNESTARERQKLDAIPYLQWGHDGWLTIIPGDLIIPEWVETKIHEDRKTFNIHSVAYDRHLITQMISGINAEIGPVSHTQTKEWMEGFAQTIPNYTAPLLELERMVIEKQLNHGKNPILAWNNRNVTIIANSKGGFMMTKKETEKNKIDGMVALAMSIGQYMTYKHTITDAYSKADVYIL